MDHAHPGSSASAVASPVEGSTDDLCWVPGQTFRMGSSGFYPEEAPQHYARVDGFWMQRHQTTNAEFGRFVDSGYITVAERSLDPADFPGAPEENLQPGSMVFTGTRGPVNLRHCARTPTACATGPAPGGRR